MRCVVRQFRLVISIEIHCVAAVMVFVSGVCNVEIGKILCIFGECCADFLYFGCQDGEFVVRFLQNSSQ